MNKMSNLMNNMQDATRRSELENEYSSLRLEAEKDFSVRKEELERDI
jgi:hypothetical protein